MRILTSDRRVERHVDEPLFRRVRREEFGRLDATGTHYLDYTGSGLYFESLVQDHTRMLATRVMGNPHSANLPSRASSDVMDEARTAVLTFFGVDCRTHDVVFTANASQALRLVAEAFPFSPASRFTLLQDNHNSVNGIRVHAERRGARTTYLPLDPDLRRDGSVPIPPAGSSPSLFAFPAQSNLSGVRHDLGLVAEAQRLGYRVALDAAAYVPTSPLDLHAVPADYVCVSFYKMFGYPTGLGALVLRHEAMDVLKRPWFAGGTVDYVDARGGAYRLRPDAQSFEDGTPDFLGLMAVPAGLQRLTGLGMDRIQRRVASLTARLLGVLATPRYENGSPQVRIYGPGAGPDRGGTVAFNVLDAHGQALPFDTVVAAANVHRVALRGGCFCNPGCAEAALGLDSRVLLSCLEAEPAGAMNFRRVSACQGGAAVGAVRASVGIPTDDADVQALAELLAELRG